MAKMDIDNLVEEEGLDLAASGRIPVSADGTVDLTSLKYSIQISRASGKEMIIHLEPSGEQGEGVSKRPKEYWFSTYSKG